MQDILSALITHLKTVSAITTLTSTRIYGGELPAADVPSMPRECIVIRYAGSLALREGLRTHRIQRQRIDVFSYGDGYLEAGGVDRAVADALIAISRLVVSSTLIHSVGYGGAIQLVDPEGGWHYVVRSATVIAAERATV